MKNDYVFENTFQNLSQKKMTFEQVFQNIVQFMENDPTGNFKLMFGTDSQVYSRETIFITGIVIQRQRKGVWACFRKVIIPRQMTNLHERISYETTLTEEVVSFFTNQHKERLIHMVLPHVYKGASFSIEGHIDIGAGTRNKTSIFVKEMIARMNSLGLKAKIKPDSFVASSYANRYTK